MWVSEIIVEPYAFFEERDPASRRSISVFIVLLAVVSTISGGLLLLDRIAQIVPESAELFVAVGFSLGILSSIVGVFGTWIILATVFHSIATVYYDRNGNLRNTIYTVAWGFIPVIFNGIVTAFFMYMLLQQANFPADPGEINQYLQQLKSTRMFQMTKILSIAFFIWQGMIWHAAITSLYDLSARESAVTVSIPLLFILGYQLQGIL